jgi:hypothetical protein
MGKSEQKKSKSKGSGKRLMVSKHHVAVTHLPRTVGSIFLDSGAHSLYSIEVINKDHKDGYAYYRTKRFKRYVNRYAQFLKEHAEAIDHYVNVDAIFNPELTWQVQKYLEEYHGLKPIPVIHYGTPFKWVDRYLNAGYTYLGIGGLGQEVTRKMYYDWADRLFDKLCPDSNHRKPIVKTHGFAMTSYPLLIRYPWFSVDSASWAKLAGFGCIYVPHLRNGIFDFSKTPYTIGFSYRSEAAKVSGSHYLSLRDGEKKVVEQWLDHIKMPMGEVDKEGKPIEYGVLSQYNARAVANLLFFEKLCEWLPKWPWAFKVRVKRGFFPEGLK